MRHTSLVLLLLNTFTFQSQASVKQELQTNYQQFNKTRLEFLKSELNSKNIKDQYTKTLKELESYYAKSVQLENDNPKFKLSSEGNQMAYDIEVLQTLKHLASNSVTKENCENARHEQELNFPITKDDQGLAIDQIINKICK